MHLTNHITCSIDLGPQKNQTQLAFLTAYLPFQTTTSVSLKAPGRIPLMHVPSIQMSISLQTLTYQDMRFAQGCQPRILKKVKRPGLPLMRSQAQEKSSIGIQTPVAYAYQSLKDRIIQARIYSLNRNSI